MRPASRSFPRELFILLRTSAVGWLYINYGLGNTFTAGLLGQRVFFLHDGRASDLADAIVDHCPTATPSSGASTTNESCGSVSLFLGLTKAQQQDILDYLRSL